jgi:3-oxoacyl-[acyl-carrier protein] reductase
MDIGRCLEGRAAAVTGAGRGIGRAVALAAACCGARVLCVDRDRASAEAAAAAIAAAGGEARAAAADVRDGAALADAFGAAARAFGRFDAAFACAGVYPAMALDAITTDHWSLVIDVNLKGAFNTVRAAAALMDDGGAIVVVSSITGNRVGYPGLTAYAAAKAGVNGLIRSAALELAPRRIRVNGVEPGTVRTEGFVEASGAAGEALASVIPLGRLGDPDEIAWPMMFLASGAASYVTGQTLVIDGGQILPETPLA